MKKTIILLKTIINLRHKKLHISKSDKLGHCWFYSMIKALFFSISYENKTRCTQKEIRDEVLISSEIFSFWFYKDSKQQKNNTLHLKKGLNCKIHWCITDTIVLPFDKTLLSNFNAMHYFVYLARAKGKNVILTKTSFTLFRDKHFSHLFDPLPWVMEVLLPRIRSLNRISVKFGFLLTPTLWNSSVKFLKASFVLYVGRKIISLVAICCEKRWICGYKLRLCFTP